MAPPVYNRIDLKLQTPSLHSEAAASPTTRVEDALAILEALRAPAELLNKPSAVALLALAGVEPHASWTDASTPMLGVTEILNFSKRRYGCELDVNDRATLQRITLPFFKSRRLVLVNPDDPRRPATSRYCVHQLDQLAVALVRSFGTDAYPAALAALMQATADSMPQNDADASLPPIAACLSTGERLLLCHGPTGELTRCLLEVFCPKFAPGGKVLYIAGAPAKSPFRNDQVLIPYGLVAGDASTLPDLVVHDTRKNRLVLVDASDGETAIDDDRRAALENAFAGSTRRLVMITAFLSRTGLVRTIDQISTETRAWVAESPSRLIQFNSSRSSGST